MSKTDWVSIREAVEISGKPEITIRRLVKRLISDKSVTTQNVKSDKSGSSQKYLIRRQYIVDLYKLKDDKEMTNQVTSHDKSNDMSTTNQVTSHELFDVLRQELVEKNKQIEKLQEALKNQQVLNLEITRHLDKIALPPSENKESFIDHPQKAEKKKNRWWIF